MHPPCTFCDADYIQAIGYSADAAYHEYLNCHTPLCTPSEAIDSGSLLRRPPHQRFDFKQFWLTHVTRLRS